MSEAANASTPYELLGGETGLRQLINRFYDLMDTAPEYYGIRKLHPQDLSGSRDKLFMFLSGWLGGPGLYVEKFGHAPASSEQGSRLRDANVRESGAAPLQAGTTVTSGVASPKGPCSALRRPCCARDICRSLSAMPNAMRGWPACSRR